VHRMSFLDDERMVAQLLQTRETRMRSRRAMRGLWSLISSRIIRLGTTGLNLDARGTLDCRDDLWGAT